MLREGSEEAISEFVQRCLNNIGTVGALAGLAELIREGEEPFGTIHKNRFEPPEHFFFVNFSGSVNCRMRVKRRVKATKFQRIVAQRLRIAENSFALYFGSSPLTPNHRFAADQVFVVQLKSGSGFGAEVPWIEDQKPSRVISNAFPQIFVMLKGIENVREQAFRLLNRLETDPEEQKRLNEAIKFAELLDEVQPYRMLYRINAGGNTSKRVALKDCWKYLPWFVDYFVHNNIFKR
jgi:hypothetical protein